MSSFASIRPRVADWRGWLPLAALPPLMFAALLALGGDRWHFYREDGFHNHATAKTLGIAENLSPEHNFLLTRRVWLDEDGGFEYAPYGRFPIGGFALVKLAILPFGNDLTAKLTAARVFTLVVFCGAALFACLAVARIAGSRWIALAATTLAFSGLYAVYYADAVFSENVMELFGVALTFHGIAVFAQEGRFRQLVVKACAALLLGWHVYALLLPFIALGFGGEAFALWRSARASGEKAKAARAAIISLVRSRYIALAAVAILFGAALLSFNLANEYAAYRGEKTLSQLPTFRSMLTRFGLGEIEDPDLAWGNFFRRQFYRAGAASVPYAVVRGGGYDFSMFEPFEPPLAPAVLGIAATCAALALLAFARRRRVPLTAVVLLGFCWAIPMRHNTFAWYHPYEGLHYVWLALGLFALALIGARRLLGARLGGRAAIAAAALAAPIFALSVFHAGQLDRDEYETALNKAALTDFSAIREIARGKSVQVVGDPLLWTESAWFWDFWMRYALSGSYLGPPSDCSRAADADFVVTRYRDESLNLLTPENRFAFLYGATSPAELCRVERRRLESLEPAARAGFDVYIQDHAVSYLKAPCETETRDYAAPFFIYVYPVDSDDLHPIYARERFHPTLGSVTLADRGAVFDGACLMTLNLPNFPVSAIRTGQRAPDGESLWDVFAVPPLNAEALEYYEETYQAITSSGEPSARAGFDLYLDRDGDTLSYLKEPCDADDARGRFFLSVHPVDVDDLPADRREAGHESLNFDFAPPFGAVFGDKCMANRRLPDYEIAGIETGQWIPGGERLWDAALAVGE